jgi:UDP-N-acetylmuramoyl-tripeptide--D-alanyl-D-alanine ligase
MTRTERNMLIVDAYNANPTRMEAALGNFASVEAENKLILLGDMLELGDESLNEHVRIASMAMKMDSAKVCFVGKEFRKALESFPESKAHSFLTSDELAQWLEENPVCDSAVLIKGSRSTRMEKVILIL